MKPELPPFPETQFLVRMLLYYNELANTALKIFCSSQHLGRSYQVFRVCFKLKINISRLNAEDTLASTAPRAKKLAEVKQAQLSTLRYCAESSNKRNVEIAGLRT